MDSVYVSAQMHTWKVSQPKGGEVHAVHWDRSGNAGEGAHRQSLCTFLCPLSALSHTPPFTPDLQRGNGAIST